MSRWSAYETYASLYRGYPGSLACKYAGDTGANASVIAPLTLNVIRSCVDTAVSKIATKNQPKAMYVTDGADFTTRMLAKDAEDFVAGTMYRARGHQAAGKAFRSAGIFGEGFVKTYAEKDEIRVRSLAPWEVVIDEPQGRYGDLPAIYHVRYYDRFALARAYPEQREDILKVPARSDVLRAFHVVDGIANVDMIRVVEGWRTDERHLMVVDDIILEDAPLEGDSPISKILWGCDPVVDVFGCGLGEQLRGVQLEINDLIGDIQEGHGLIKGYLALSDDAKIVTEKFNNDIRKIIRFSGTIPPQYVVPSIIAPEVYQHLWQLYAKAFEICGVSQINATGTTAEGLTSAVGQRTYQDQQTERFLETVRAYEDFVTRGIAPNIMRCANENMSVRSFVGTRVAKKIQWSSDMATIDAEIRCYPGSMLPDTPAGRMSWGQDMLQLGADPGTVMENIGIQDPDDILRRLMARRFIIQKNIESIVRKGNYVGPEPSDDHKLAMDLVNDAYAEARLDGVPEERKQMLLNYMRSTQGFIDRMAQAAQAAAQSAQPLTQQASQQ